MAQNSVNYSNNPTGPELLDDYLDKEQENILTSNSGIQRPSYADVGTKWLDISSTPWALKIFDGTSDVIIGTVNPTTHAFTPAGIDTAVLLTGNQTIGGTKTFTVSPQVPTASSGDSSSDVANTAFVTSADSNLQTQINQKANSSDVVHKTGDETISGLKTFKQYLLKQNDNITKGTAPSSDSYNLALNCTDTNNKKIGMVELGYLTDKKVKMTIGAYNGNTSSDGDGGVYLELWNDNGTGYVKCPASDANNTVVTTVSKTKAGNGYFKLGNGMIVQWGTFTAASSDGTATVTFPTSFTSTNYCIGYSFFEKSRSATGQFNTKTKTSAIFKSDNFSNTGTIMYIAIGY